MDTLLDAIRQNDNLRIRLVSPAFGHLSAEEISMYPGIQRRDHYFLLFMISGNAQHLKTFLTLYLQMKILILLSLAFSITICSGQPKGPEHFGFRYVKTVYKGDTVDVLIKSRKGDEQKSKPLFLFCQGSLPQPLIKYDEKGMFGVFPFSPDSLVQDFHLVIIGKPHIPVVADIRSLEPDFTYRDSTDMFPASYTARNYLEYYVKRDIEVLETLSREKWVSQQTLVVAGHSEGSTIAARIASIFPKVTHLIYSGGNPMGRIVTMIGHLRAIETETTRDADRQFDIWKNIVTDSASMRGEGDTYKATYDFSFPPIVYLQTLRIPVLITFGTRDAGAPFNDYLHVETIKQRRSNFTYHAYIGTEHNYFPMSANGSIDYNVFNWDKVAEDWRRWLSGK